MAIKILLNGCYGRMGRMFTQTAAKYQDLLIVAGLDVVAPLADGFSLPPAYPVYIVGVDKNSGVDALEGVGFDIIVDFSNPAMLNMILGLADARSVPVIFATTGFSEAQLGEISAASQKIPVFRSANMSIGINLMSELIKTAAAALADGFDIELVEAHHNQKLDAPSGTALMLADAMNETLDGGLEYVYDRHEIRAKRGKKELGIHAIRGGTIVGEHSVIFAGSDEVIEIRHTAASRVVFAEGAVRAVRYMTAGGRAPGCYSMRDIVTA